MIRLRYENGKVITADASGATVALIIWRKNQAPQLALQLAREEAVTLAAALTTAVETAEKEVAARPARKDKS